MSLSRGSILLREALARTGDTCHGVEQLYKMANGTLGKLTSGQRSPGRVIAAHLLQRYAIPLLSWDDDVEAVDE